MADPHPKDLYPKHFPKLRANAFRDAIRRIKGRYAESRVLAQFIAMADDKEFRELLDAKELSDVDTLLPGVKSDLMRHDFGIG